jgi:hypothetical protein
VLEDETTFWPWRSIGELLDALIIDFQHRYARERQVAPTRSAVICTGGAQ